MTDDGVPGYVAGLSDLAGACPPSIPDGSFPDGVAEDDVAGVFSANVRSARLTAAIPSYSENASVRYAELGGDIGKLSAGGISSGDCLVSLFHGHAARLP
jgi:hypothetical protein